MGAVLEDEGKRLASASDRSAGLRLAIKLQLALIVLGLRIPQLNGLEIAQRPKRRSRTRPLCL
jgi:CheY-like chemotaxis protein